jgi:tRNA(Ile)-lysidine synthase
VQLPGAVRLRARLHRHLRRHGLLDPAYTVLVALSGGLDSVCLLHLLRFASCRPRLAAAHFDHRMRPGSAADAAWVRGLCRAWSVPLVSGAAASPPRSETAARALRYDFLERAAVEQRADVIVTAHHADDQAETVLFRLVRGTGLPGLAGIPARRGRIVRPLLSLGRAEFRAYARACGIQWREDPSNRDLRPARNRIRHQILPALEAVRPGVARRVAALAARAAEAEAAWLELVRKAAEDVVTAQDARGLTLARDRLLAYHPHVRARVLRHLLNGLGSHPGRAGTRVALEFIVSGASGARVELAGGVGLSREFDRLLLGRAHPAAAPLDVPLQIRSAEAGAGVCVIGGRRYFTRWAPAMPAEKPGLTACFDPAAVRFPLELRGWHPGDRIRLSYGSKKLKELFRERRIGREARLRVPVLRDSSGRVLWVVGVARAEAARPRPGANAFQVSVVDGDTV